MFFIMAVSCMGSCPTLKTENNNNNSNDDGDSETIVVVSVK